MDVLTPAPQQARPQYGVIALPGDLTLPLDLEAMARGRRTELEIGFGNGEYTVKHARRTPDVLLWGIELSPACVLRCARRAAGLDNLRLIRTDARRMMKELFRDEALDRVYMNFPCPWPKRRHAHRRVTARDFTDSLAAVLRLGGVFELLTDDEPYAHEALDRIGNHTALEGRGFEVNPVRSVTTKYERKWLELGKPIYRLTFVKTRPFTTARQTWEGSEVHIRTRRRPTEECLSALADVSGGAGDARWSFGRLALERGPEGGFLLEAFSNDEEFDQRYYIHISPRDGGALVRLDRTANAFLTPAVKGALADVAARIDAAEEPER